MTPARPVPVEPYFGSFILETLTVGMYGESRNAIREYVQNGFDSIQRATKELKQLKAGDGLIRVIFGDDRDSLTILDNGAGLPEKVAASTLTSVGASRKDYRVDAGFRGIGRLAGIVFSSLVTFRTKAAGEAEETRVTFKAAQMRELMSPGQGNKIQADELLRRCIEITVAEAEPSAPPFFEVVLSGFSDPPTECVDPDAMRIFLSQVAPVPYGKEFPHGKKLRDEGRSQGIPIDEVNVQIEADSEITPVFKPYTANYEVQDIDDLVPLDEVQIFTSPTKRWWGWLGKKDRPGSFTDGNVRGIRVRARNIQIDGADVVRDIFQKRSASNARFQDWFLGEIFADVRALTPNARRDSFEETPIWKAVQKEIADSVCREAGRSAHSISSKGQLTLEKLREKTDRLNEGMEALRRTGSVKQDQAITLSAEATKLQRDIAKAARGASPEAQAELQLLTAQLLDVKVEALEKITNPHTEVDQEAIEQKAREALLAELLVLFEDQLSTPCLASVRDLIETHYDFPSSKQ
jgi:molecular chaperone HtpG